MSPESRSYQFYAKPWPANEIEAPKLPAGGTMAAENAYENSFEFPADGKLASGNNGSRAQMDNEGYPWRMSPMKSGEQQFQWHLQAQHRTTYFTYYITKPDWKSKPGYGQRLTREMFEDKPFCHKIYAYSPTPALDQSMPVAYTTHTCNVPQRSGEQKIYAVWRVRDTGNAFYQMVDVKFDGENPPEEVIQAPKVTLNHNALSVVGTGDWGWGYRYTGTSDQNNVNWKWEYVEGDKRIYLRDYQHNGASVEFVVPKEVYNVSAKYRLVATNGQQKSGEAIATLTVVKPAVSITGGNSMPAANPLQLQAKANFANESYTWRLLRGSQVVNGGISQQGVIASGLAAGDYSAEVTAWSERGQRSATSTHAVKITAGVENNDQAFIAALKLAMNAADNGASVTFSGGVTADTVPTSTPVYQWTLPSGAQNGSQGAAQQQFTLAKTSQAQNLQVKVKVSAGSPSRELTQSITVPAVSVPVEAEAYNSKISYPLKCTSVSYKGQVWQNQWYVNPGQEEPGTGGAWGAWRAKNAATNTCP
ncbi:lytic polysaccharide monooxygenase [Erwiniaceae bacterium BAC15a-03b]|uniref:Lytic polysaccharide monooxygenase n=1 Tax=Winslowiella arboricola TaxID=2978220 RepID=A0A9J6PUB8_9GAMM|nr:lytic polysaccharide monooxygenase [Winslowiella arboricola]MCU5773242.1 lytic polysaccharide monooxygenase [Winslowiella arboricola]MCU5779128.1 lytic polysaccharide monooxygenase [Winslowiella arboricola]